MEKSEKTETEQNYEEEEKVIFVGNSKKRKMVFKDEMPLKRSKIDESTLTNGKLNKIIPS